MRTRRAETGSAKGIRRTLRTAVPALAVVAALGAGTVGTAGTANAATATNGIGVVKLVFGSHNPRATYNALPPALKALFNKTEKPGI